MKWVGDGVLKIGKLYYGRDGFVYNAKGVLITDQKGNPEICKNLPVEKLGEKQLKILLAKGDIEDEPVKTSKKKGK
jgi:hypothetical protein